MNNQNFPHDLWTKEYQDWIPDYYEKSMVDIILKNGDEIIGCWPNAGFMNPCHNAHNPKKYLEIPYADVARVRLTHHKRWNE